MEIKQFDPNHEGPMLGVIRNENEQIYHATHAISNSKLSDFRKRKYLYYKKYIKKNIAIEFKKKDHFVFGGAGHCLILEGEEEFNKRYIIEPVNAPGKPRKQRHEYETAISPNAEAKLSFWEKFNKEAKGLEVLSQEQFRTLQYVKWSVEQNEVATALISEITPELTFRVDLGWHLAQVRVDGFIESCSEELAGYLNEAYPYMLDKDVQAGDCIAIDLKTCATLTEDDSGSFQKQFGDHGYYIQDTLYREVVSNVMQRPLDHFLFIAVEKQEPFETVVYSTDSDDIELGRQELTLDLNELRNCFKTKQWFSFPQEEIKSISIPRWTRTRAELRLQMEADRNR